MINLDEFNVTHITEWFPVAEIPTDKSARYRLMAESYGTVGVYQVALTKDIEDIGKNLIHSEIGYTGSSHTILKRTYSIRAPKGDHGASRHIRQEGLDRGSDVCIRYVYTDISKYTDLERKIFELTLEKYGYRFKWTNASAGITGKYSQMIDYATDLSSEELLQALGEIKDLIIQKVREEAEQKIKEKINTVLSEC